MVTDLGCAELARTADRVPLELKRGTFDVPICTLQYRPPDVILGNQNFGTDLDMWSLGCLSAELSLREPLFKIAETDAVLEKKTEIDAVLEKNRNSTDSS